MDKIDELMDEIVVSAVNIIESTEFEESQKWENNLNKARAALRSEFDAQEKMINELKNDLANCRDERNKELGANSLRALYNASTIRTAKLESENERLKAENAALKEALDISHKNHDRCNRDYVLLKHHLEKLNNVVDALCPKVARAISKITPPSIGSENYADHKFARELRCALDAVTDVQNTEYTETEAE